MTDFYFAVGEADQDIFNHVAVVVLAPSVKLRFTAAERARLQIRHGHHPSIL